MMSGGFTFSIGGAETDSSLFFFLLFLFGEEHYVSGFTILRTEHLRLYDLPSLWHTHLTIIGY